MTTGVNGSPHFDPPAPIARVILRNPDSGATAPDIGKRDRSHKTRCSDAENGR